MGDAWGEVGGQEGGGGEEEGKEKGKGGEASLFNRRYLVQTRKVVSGGSVACIPASVCDGSILCLYNALTAFLATLSIPLPDLLTKVNFCKLEKGVSNNIEKA